jgi:hypothetical protein
MAKKPAKNPAAVALALRRAAKLTAEQRHDIARRAAAGRFGTDEQQRTLWNYIEAEISPRDRAARQTPELCRVTPGFFAAFAADEIAPVLRKWKLADRIRSSAALPVVLTADGIRSLEESPAKGTYRIR